MEDTQENAEFGTLVLVAVWPKGRALGLREGDALESVNGVPFDGQVATLLQRIGTQGRTVALTFQRKGRRFVVLADSAALGKWKAGPEFKISGEYQRLYPEVMDNWEVFSDAEGRYEFQRLSRPIFALIMPPLWLAAMRLWGSLGVWFALMIIAMPAGTLVSILVAIMLSLYFWQAGTGLFRMDRLANGSVPIAILAATSEEALHVAIKILEPELEYKYAPRQSAGPVDRKV